MTPEYTVFQLLCLPLFNLKKRKLFAQWDQDYIDDKQIWIDFDKEAIGLWDSTNETQQKNTLHAWSVYT